MLNLGLYPVLKTRVDSDQLASQYLSKHFTTVFTLTMLNLGMYRVLKTSVDLYQLASQKPADQDPHFFSALLVNKCL